MSKFFDWMGVVYVKIMEEFFFVKGIVRYCYDLF